MKLEHNIFNKHNFTKLKFILTYIFKLEKRTCFKKTTICLLSLFLKLVFDIHIHFVYLNFIKNNHGKHKTIRSGEQRTIY